MAKTPMIWASGARKEAMALLGRTVSTIVRQPGREIKLSSFGPWPVG